MPRRARVIRTMFAEITRILNHLLNVTTYALDCGAITPAFGASSSASTCWSSTRRWAARTTTSTISVPAAWPRTCPPAIEERIARLVPAVPEIRRASWRTLLTENRIFKQRTVDIGVMTPEQAMEWGFSGPCLRASGCAWDLRKSQPYEIYSELDFDIPVGRHGDCYDRYLVRVREMTAVAADRGAVPGRGWSRGRCASRTARSRRRRAAR